MSGARETELVKETARILCSAHCLEEALEELVPAVVRLVLFDCTTLSWTDSNGWDIHSCRVCPGSLDPDVILATDSLVAMHTQLMFRQRCIGTLTLHRRGSRPFSNREHQLLHWLGTQVSPLVQNERLYQHGRRQAYQLTQVNRTACSPDSTLGPDAAAEAMRNAGLALENQRGGAGQQLESLHREALADVARSIRVPLTSIKGHADTLLSSRISWPAEIRHEFLNIIDQQADRLNQLVGDLLTPTNREIGDVLLDQLPFSIQGLLDKAAIELEKDPSRQPVMFQCDPTLPLVLVDPIRVVQVIVWLLQSASECADSALTLGVEGLWENGRPLVSVGAFVEGSASPGADLLQNPRRHGAGGGWGRWLEDDLKLVVVKSILEAHGVGLVVTPSPGLQHLFRFTLPAAPLSPQVAESGR